MANSQEKITVYNLADLKNTTDDSIPNYLNSLRFTQSHRLTDVRLALGYGSFLLAAACFAWDHQLGFERTKHLTAAAVALYTILSAALSLWVWLVERGTIYIGTAPSGETVRVSSAVVKNVPVYKLKIHITPKAGSKGKEEEIALDRPFAEWFDAAGHFIAAPFQIVLATGVPCVGKLDPKRVAGAEKLDGVEYTPEVLEALARASANVAGSVAGAGTGETSKGAEVTAASASGSATASGGKKGGKRRKA